MKQYRIIGLGNYAEYYSNFLFGVLQGAALNNAWFKSIDLFKFNFNEIWNQILEFKPHVLFCHMIFSKNRVDFNGISALLKRVRSIGTKVVYHAGDARAEPRHVGPINSIVDFALCNHNLLNKYSSIWQIPCYYWPYQCFNQNDIVDVVQSLRCEIAFTGSLDNNIHHSPRAAFIKNLNDFVRVKIFPTPETGNTRYLTAELSSSANAVLGFQMGLDIPGYIDVRPWQYIGAGALYFHDKVADGRMDRFFTDGVHYIAFNRNDAGDFYNKYNYYVNEFPEKAMQIKRAGFEYCQKYHSSKQRIEAVISLIETGKYWIWAPNKAGEIVQTKNPWENRN